MCSCSSLSILCRLEPWCIVLYLGWLLVLVIAPCVVPCALIVSFVRRSPIGGTPGFGLGGGADMLVVERWSGVERAEGGQSDVKGPNGVLPSDEERDGSIRRVLNLKATPSLSCSSRDTFLVMFWSRQPPGCILVAIGFLSHSYQIVLVTASLGVGFVATSRCQAWGRSSAGLRLFVCGVLYGGSLASHFQGGTLQLFRSLFLGASPCGIGVCVSLTSWRVGGPGWFCLWALDLVEVWDGGACVMRLWSHVVALVFCELFVSAGKTAELFSFGRLKEEKLKPLNSVNWRVNEVNQQPHHRQRESGGVREIQRSAGDGAETKRPQLFSGDHGCVLMDTWLDPVNMANKPTFEYDDNVNEIVGMINTDVQPEESIQSSSQADNEEVSLRVNPTHTQNAQEDSEFSKLMSRYSPDEIISMLSKHTIRAAASHTTPSLSPFNASTSRPTPRPVTSPQMPVSTFIPSPTPAPFPTPILTPPSAHSPPAQITPPTQSESIPRSEVEGLVRKLLAESLSLSKPHSLQNYCKLPNTYFPPGFKAPKYRKYNETSDPQYHLAGFTMDSHRWMYDRVLLVHLFQQSLEGEALRWFTSLPASDLVNFDIVSERFISHFSYMATQVPTLPDLVAERMKPDEDFVTFANRWRSMASKVDIPIPESQAITMLVTNTTPVLRSILMLSKFPSFAHLYNRARVVQNQIKDSSLPHFFEGKPKGRKAPAAPTTEGVTLNESVSACCQPLRPPNKPSNPPSNPHQLPLLPPMPYSYSSIPPSSGYTGPGPKRASYPPLPKSLGDIFFALVSCDAIQLPPQKEAVHPRADTSRPSSNDEIFVRGNFIRSWDPPFQLLTLLPQGQSTLKTAELFSLGRLKEEKLKPRLRPLCEATAPTWSTSNPIIANESPAASASVREI
ncbi:hypothetical protein Taro_002533 [Colocasia esculenta]|uniref:Retrotransposon gag domain-containing protein n=1 Tax=Colocasia esculenta TaxID=4460 RepID=A0A843TLR2_COLES|nr:hypothetical protein [Colocasia esculenta]